MPNMFWSQAAAEPKRQHRFLLELPLLGVSTGGKTGPYEKYPAKTVSKPSYTLGVTEHKFLGNTFHYPGAVTWDEVSATLVNSINPNGDEILYEALYACGYHDPEDLEGFFLSTGLSSPGTPNKVNSLGALGKVQITELNGEGLEIDRWILNNAFITSVKFGDLDYSGEELLNIDLTFRYDWATYETLTDYVPGMTGDALSDSADAAVPIAPRVGARGLI